MYYLLGRGHTSTFMLQKWISVTFPWHETVVKTQTPVLKSAIFVWNKTMKTRQARLFICLFWIVCCIWPIIYLQNLHILKLELCHLLKPYILNAPLTHNVLQLSKTETGCRWADIFLFDGAQLWAPGGDSDGRPQRCPNDARVCVLQVRR